MAKSTPARSKTPVQPKKRRVRWWWIAIAVLVVVLIPVAIVAAPILTHQNQGLSGQVPSTEKWPLTVSGHGDDGRDRSFTVRAADGSVLDTSAIGPGDQLIVSGTGFDASQGIYVAICKIPADSTIKPGPCIGGVPEQKAQEVAKGTIQYAPSNWINDDWAWKLFGSRSYDDVKKGTFTAYIVVGNPSDDKLDCRTDACGIFTRNDHTALSDRVQDLYVPVQFAG
jgi:hypothetical protein